MDSAVIFDMDGTLLDTEVVWDDVRRELAAEAGIPWPESATTAMMGMSTPEWSAYMVDRVGFRVTQAEATELVIGGMRRAYRRGVPVLPGAVEAVRRMASRWPLGCASSSPRVLVEAGLEFLGVRDLFAAVRSTEEGPARGKPHPDAYLWVAQELGADPGRCLVVEDSGNGVAAGLAAGMHVVAVPPAFHPPSPDLLARCDAVLETLDGLTVDLVAGLLGP